MHHTASERWYEFVAEFRSGRHPRFPEHWRLYQALQDKLTPEDGPLAAWRPGEAERASSNVAALLREVGLESYFELHRWSVENRAEFWRRVVGRLGIQFERNPEQILDLDPGVEDPRWLPGAELNIVDSCFQAAAETPAIISGSETGDELLRITYGDLEAVVNRIANGLREQGLGEGEAIVLYMPMTIECVAAYLGIVRAGCQVVSVADSFSARELRRRMEITGASAVVCLAAYEWAGKRIDLYSKVRQAIGETSGSVRCIVIPALHDASADLAAGDLLWEEFLSPETSFQSSVGAPDRITNVLFSSGTTGDPKAIPWTHLAPVKCAMDGHFHHDIHPGDVVAWPTNIGWMMGPWLIYASLLNRATLALFGGAPHSADFTSFVDSSGITMLGLVPALVRAWRSKRLVEANAWRTIRVFSSTGEVSNPEDYLWLMSRTGYRAPVIEYLGGTEIGGGHATGTVLRAAAPSTFSTPALGIDFVILNEKDRPVEVGQMGELYLIPPSIGLSQTLLNEDHHQIYYAGCPSGPSGEVLRRHGDQFMRLGKGYFRAQGRVDDTMNLGGIKVSSIEFEEVLNEHPAVLESAAIAVQIANERADRLVVYAVLDQEIDTDQLTRELRQRIATQLNPLFKIHELVVIDSLPRTASNKVMRRELRRRYLEAAAI